MFTKNIRKEITNYFKVKIPIINTINIQGTSVSIGNNFVGGF